MSYPVMSIEQERVLRHFLAQGMDLPTARTFALNASKAAINNVVLEFDKLDDIYSQLNGRLPEDVVIKDMPEYKDQECIITLVMSNVIASVYSEHTHQNAKR